MRSDVLVATDDAGRARALAAQLCDAGYDVLSTTDAAVILSALRLAWSWSPAKA